MKSTLWVGGEGVSPQHDLFFYWLLATDNFSKQSLMSHWLSKNHKKFKDVRVLTLNLELFKTGSCPHYFLAKDTIPW
jgi:hypothetical protein